MSTQQMYEYPYVEANGWLAKISSSLILFFSWIEFRTSFSHHFVWIIEYFGYHEKFPIYYVPLRSTFFMFPLLGGTQI
jgi:hypothetical protein